MFLPCLKKICHCGSHEDSCEERQESLIGEHKIFLVTLQVKEQQLKAQRGRSRMRPTKRQTEEETNKNQNLHSNFSESQRGKQGEVNKPTDKGDTRLNISTWGSHREELTITGA